MLGAGGKGGGLGGLTHLTSNFSLLERCPPKTTEWNNAESTVALSWVPDPLSLPTNSQACCLLGGARAFALADNRVHVWILPEY